MIIIKINNIDTDELKVYKTLRDNAFDDKKPAKTVKKESAPKESSGKKILDLFDAFEEDDTKSDDKKPKKKTPKVQTTSPFITNLLSKFNPIIKSNLDRKIGA